MSGVRFRANTAQVATGTSAKTLCQVVAAANHRVLITEIEVAFEGVTSNDPPIQIEILKQTDAGTMTSLSPVKVNTGDGETLQTTAQHTATAEPTAGTVIRRTLVHPQAAYRLLLARENAIVVNGGERLGVKVLASVGIDAVVSLGGEE